MVVLGRKSADVAANQRRNRFSKVLHNWCGGSKLEKTGDKQKNVSKFVCHVRILMAFLNFAGSPCEISVKSSGAIGPKMSVIGETVRLMPVNQVASFEISAVGFKRNDIRATVSSELRGVNRTVAYRETTSINRLETCDS